MPCIISKSRKRACKDQRGGVKKIDFAPWAEYGFVVAAKKIAALPKALTAVYRYEIKGPQNKLDENVTVSTENGTRENVQTLPVILTKLDAATEEELETMAADRVIAFVHDFNGNVKVAGLENGLDVTTLTASTGGAGTDLSGYSINLQGMESKTAPFLSPAAIIELNALVVSVGTIEP